jgi:hypothetical protein
MTDAHDRTRNAMPISSERKTQQALESLRADLQAGLDSGPATPLDMEAVRVEGRRLHALWQQALADKTVGVAADDVFDRLERKYQVDATAKTHAP